MEVLYEFIFSVGGVVSPFKICDSYPRMEIPPDAKKTIGDSPILSGMLLRIELDDDFSDPLDLLQVYYEAI